MSDIKRIDPTAFKTQGFLQECNRAWFHPHGLALELTMITEGDDAPLTRVSLPPAALATLETLLRNERSGPDEPKEDFSGESLQALGDAIDKAVTHGVGDCYFSGCWDYRSDPEGVLFGSWDEEWSGKVESVLAERRKHYENRCKLFGATPVPSELDHPLPRDVEPVGFEYKDTDG